MAKYSGGRTASQSGEGGSQIKKVSKARKQIDSVLARYKDMLDFVTNSTDEEFGIVYEIAQKSNNGTHIKLMMSRIQYRGYCQLYP